MKIYLVLLVVTSIILVSCGTPHEAVMPFRNYGYTGERIFPVKESDADFSFRASVNFSSSVDRIFSLSSDTLFGNQGSMIEAFILKSKVSGSSNVKYRQTALIPKSGFKQFIKTVDSLNLITVKNQTAFEHAMHEPVTLFVIEVKHHGVYNQFKFNGTLRDISTKNDIYSKIQRLIVSEFDFKLYFKK